MTKQQQFKQVIAQLSGCYPQQNSSNIKSNATLNKEPIHPKIPNAFDLQKKDEELRRKKIENDISENELALKKGIYFWVKWVVTIYLSFVAITILALFTGFGSLSDNVVIALLSTTTINILGLPYMIIKSLFPNKNNSK